VRSYAFVLVIPRRKTSLSEAPHGRWPWPNVNLHGSSPERGRRGAGLRGAAWERRGQLGGRHGGGGLQGGHGGAALLLRCVCFRANAS
jgi:hypothetical protein